MNAPASTWRAPLGDVLFSLNHVLGLPARCRRLAPDLDATTTQAILGAVAAFAQDELVPLSAPGDLQGARWQAGRVQAPDGFAAAWRRYVADGWPALAQPAELGGQGLPCSLHVTANEFLQGANPAWCMYAGLNEGAVATLRAARHPPEGAAMLPPLVRGDWTATMCLAQAHAGSDLGLLRTRAEPAAGGMHRLHGQKIFISSGDHDLADNIVHLVLARLPDAAAGVRGISLFAVPRQRPDGPANGVHCVAIEHKMGLRGSATRTLAFEGAQGWLVGAPHRGLAAMFVFVDRSRLGVALQAVAQAQAAHDVALAHARERLQGRAQPPARPDLAADPIVAHPDVRRMLLVQKAAAEGGRTLVHTCACWMDEAERDPDPSARARAQRLLGLVTPIAKGFLAELGCEAVDLGLQVLGGHGDMRDRGLEQRLRDVRISRIHEGTSAIQGMDLLGRRLLPDREALALLLAESAPERRRWPALQVAFDTWQAVTDEGAARAEADPGLVPGVAGDCLMLAGCAVLGWMLARRCAAAPDSAAGAALMAFHEECFGTRLAAHASSVRGGARALRAGAAALA